MAHPTNRIRLTHSPVSFANLRANNASQVVIIRLEMPADPTSNVLAATNFFVSPIIGGGIWETRCVYAGSQAGDRSLVHKVKFHGEYTLSVPRVVVDSFLRVCLMGDLNSLSTIR